MLLRKSKPMYFSIFNNTLPASKCHFLLNMVCLSKLPELYVYRQLCIFSLVLCSRCKPSQINYKSSFVGKQNIIRFQIVVQDAFGVQMMHSFNQVGCKSFPFFIRHLFANSVGIGGSVFNNLSQCYRFVYNTFGSDKLHDNTERLLF